MTQARNRVERMRRTGLMAGALALLLQLVAWAWMPAWIGSANAASLESGIERVVICTPEGFKTVSLAVSEERSGTPAADKAGGDALDHDCPLCPLVGGLAVAAPPPDVSPAEIGRHGAITLPGSRIAAGWFLSTLQARAPPAIG